MIRWRRGDRRNAHQAGERSADNGEHPSGLAATGSAAASSARADLEHPSTESAVQGERGRPLVNSVRSVQSRVSSFLAAALMISLAVGSLTWYYLTALKRQAHLREAALASSSTRAQGEMALPALGRIDPPPVRGVPSVAPPAVTDQASGAAAAGLQAGSGLQPSSAPPPSATLQPSTGVQSPANLQPAAALQALPDLAPAADLSPATELQPLTQLQPTPVRSPAANKTPRQRALERRLSGAAFVRDSQGARELPGATHDSQVAQSGLPAAVPTDSSVIGASPSGVSESGASEGALALSLRPTVTPARRAQILATQRFLLPKGAFIDCTLETAIDSTLPGMTTCVTATDTFSADGQVVLLERGTKLVGETRGQVQQGAARVFVLWTEARTPTGVIVPLDSPGTDELGRSGLAGEVNRHFWNRFGAAMLISLIDGAVQGAVQAASHGGGAVIYSPSASQGVMTEVLKGTLSTPPTVIKHNGDRIQVLVARDLDFRSVYELRTKR